MRVLMLGNYELNWYSRGRILYKGLKQNNVDVDLFLPKGKLKLAKIMRRLLQFDYDILLVTGKPVLLVCWLLKLFHRKPIVFDVFISDYDTLVIDRKLVPQHSVRAKLLWLGDKWSCRLADRVIHDTEEHIDYFVSEFGLPKNKFKEVLIGSDDTIFKPLKTGKHKGKKFTVFFYGTFIPLQGIEYIIRAAKLLECNREIQFDIIGSGQTYTAISALAQHLGVKNVRFLGMIPIKKFPRYISEADVCLGIFGNTPKAGRVIPNKAYDTIAMAKPLITADTPAIRKIFTDKENVLLCKAADAQSLAETIIKLKNDSMLRKKIAENGFKLFKSKLSPEHIGNGLKNYLKTFVRGA